MPDEFRDPVESLKVALGYIINSRGEKAGKASLAYNIINQRRESLEKLCIDDLLSEEGKTKGFVCPCWRHPGNFDEWLAEQPRAAMQKAPQRTHKPITGKEAASGEKEDD